MKPKYVVGDIVKFPDRLWSRAGTWAQLIRLGKIISVLPGDDEGPLNRTCNGYHIVRLTKSLRPDRRYGWHAYAPEHSIIPFKLKRKCIILPNRSKKDA